MTDNNNDEIELELTLEDFDGNEERYKKYKHYREYLELSEFDSQMLMTSLFQLDPEERLAWTRALDNKHAAVRRKNKEWEKENPKKTYFEQLKEIEENKAKEKGDLA
jgi:hypothetical protein